MGIGLSVWGVSMIGSGRGSGAGAVSGCGFDLSLSYLMDMLLSVLVEFGNASR